MRLIRAVVNAALGVLTPEFDRLYARVGRPASYSKSCSEWQQMEQIDYNLLFRWFVNLAMDAPVWDATTFQEPRPAAGRRHRPASVGHRGRPSCGR